jgi:hypothetical protein
MRKFKVMTFKESGKYYTDAEFEIPDDLQMHELSREKLLALNNGRCPGLSGRGEEFHIVLVPTGDHDFPKLLPVPRMTLR